MFVVRDIDHTVTSSRHKEHVYLTNNHFRDGAMKLHREWVYQLEYAKQYKTRRNAEKAARRWGGVVVEL